MPLFRKPAAPPAPGPAARPAAGAPGPAPAGPVIDPLAGDPVAHRIRADLAQGRWQDFHDFMEADRDWERRRFYLQKALDGITGMPDWVREWVAARPDVALPLTFRGAAAVQWAWEARGSGWSDTVQRDAWAVFHGRLVEADRDLARAAATDETDPAPHAYALVVARGLQLGLTELRRRFGEATRRDRWYVHAYNNMINGLSAKWGGSHEEMFGFARWASNSAPEGSPVHRVIASAHLLRWEHMPRDTENGKEARRAYFPREEVRAEVRQAALRSVCSPRYVPTGFTCNDRNLFAMCFGMMGDYAAQLDQMTLIGPLVTRIPGACWASPARPGSGPGRRP